jgi:hypothetical protein
MPTETTRRGVKRWKGLVYLEGKAVASKWFGPGEKGAPQGDPLGRAGENPAPGREPKDDPFGIFNHG